MAEHKHVWLSALLGLGLVGCTAHASVGSGGPIERGDRSTAVSDGDDVGGAQAAAAEEPGEAGDDHGHPHGGPPGQTGDHPQGGPPGQTGDHPQGGPPGQTGDHPQGGPPGQAQGGDSGGDRDRGHGNDPDGVDEDNPGRGKARGRKK